MQGHPEGSTEPEKRAIGPIGYMLTGTGFPGSCWGPFDTEAQAWRYYLGRDPLSLDEVAALVAEGWRVTAGRGLSASHEPAPPRL